jgi:hypothetical protein
MSTLILLKSYVLKDLGVDIKEANFFPHFLWDELDLVPLFFLWSCLFFPSSIFVFVLFLDTICQILFMQHDVLKYVCILEWLIQANQHRDCLTYQFFDENTKKFTLSFQDLHCYYLQLSCCTFEHISPTSPKFCVLWPITFSPALCILNAFPDSSHSCSCILQFCILDSQWKWSGLWIILLL